MGVLPYVVIDIETGFAPEAAVERELAGWTPPANVKDPEKIQARREEAAVTLRGKSALFDEAPVTCVSCVSGKDRHAFTAEVQGGESTMLKQLRHFLDAETGPDTVVVGHNVCSFDLPKLRSAYIRNRLTLPKLLQLHDGEEDKPRVFDTMRNFRYFSSWRHDERYVSLRDVVDAFGLPRVKDGIEGQDMPALAAAGEWGVIREYCLLDCVATEAVYLLMTCAHSDMQ